MLIECPNCKKPISDQANECIHCKHVLKNSEETANEEPIRDFLKMSVKERNALYDEFCQAEPEKSKPFSKKKYTSVLAIIMCFVDPIITFAFAALLYVHVADSPLLLFILCLLGASSPYIILSIANKKTKKALFTACKHMELWCKKNNITNYFPIYVQTSEDSKLYSKIKIEGEE